MSLAIDVGGTFTDIVVDDRTGPISTYKIPTETSNLARPILDAVRKHKIDLSNIDLALNATTIATNALIEGKTARVGLITTKGFSGVLEAAMGDWLEKR